MPRNLQRAAADLCQVSLLGSFFPLAISALLLIVQSTAQRGPGAKAGSLPVLSPCSSWKWTLEPPCAAPTQRTERSSNWKKMVVEKAKEMAGLQRG
uniref:Uncharacterized protein n=1 Tax=Chelonoidis abingdonii TaxID=106734 RepID=A0A8C0IQI5_CHEAB